MMEKLELYKDGAGSYTLKITDRGKLTVFKEKIRLKVALNLIKKYEKESCLK